MLSQLLTPHEHEIAVVEHGEAVARANAIEDRDLRLARAVWSPNKATWLGRVRVCAANAPVTAPASTAPRPRPSQTATTTSTHSLTHLSVTASAIFLSVSLCAHVTEHIHLHDAGEAGPPRLRRPAYKCLPRRREAFNGSHVRHAPFLVLVLSDKTDARAQPQAL